MVELMDKRTLEIDIEDVDRIDTYLYDDDY